MDNVKNWYQSKTVWGALVAIFASLSQALGIEIDASGQTELAENLMALAGAVGGLIALYGRFSAEKKVH
jgi:hypothetical protein